MKRQTVILPFSLPHLTDKAAAQLVDLLHELIDGIEHHYTVQIYRYRRRQRETHLERHSPPSTPTDPPF